MYYCMSLTVGVRPLMRVSILLLHFWMCLKLLIVWTKMFCCRNSIACYGVVDNSLLWFASYLLCCWQRVCLNHLYIYWTIKDPEWIPGAHQHVLHPIQKLIPLPSVVEGCQLNMYCDDMELHYSSSGLFFVQCGLQSDLNSADFWLRTNQLSLNVGKSNVMLIGSQQKLRDSDICYFLEYNPSNI